MSSPGRSAERTGFFDAQHGADVHWSCADVLRVSNLNLRRKAAEFAALRVEMVKILQQILSSLMQVLAKFCARSTAGCAHFRHCTYQKIDAEFLKRHHVLAATLAELLVRCASTAQRICTKTTFSGGVSCWHLPYQKSMCPSRICSFRRSLPQLGTARNLHF